MAGLELSKDDAKKVGFDAVWRCECRQLTALQEAKAGFAWSTCRRAVSARPLVRHSKPSTGRFCWPSARRSSQLAASRPRGALNARRVHTLPLWTVRWPGRSPKLAAFDAQIDP